MLRSIEAAAYVGLEFRQAVVARHHAPPIHEAAEEVFSFVAPAIEALEPIGFLVALQRFGMIGRAPSSLICWRTFSLS